MSSRVLDTSLPREPFIFSQEILLLFSSCCRRIYFVFIIRSRDSLSQVPVFHGILSQWCSQFPTCPSSCYTYISLSSQIKNALQYRYIRGLSQKTYQRLFQKSFPDEFPRLRISHLGRVQLFSYQSLPPKRSPKINYTENLYVSPLFFSLPYFLSTQ